MGSCHSNPSKASQSSRRRGEIKEAARRKLNKTGIHYGEARKANKNGTYTYGTAFKGGKPSSWKTERRFRVKEDNGSGFKKKAGRKDKRFDNTSKLQFDIDIDEDEDEDEE
jgi:hypothetical protein